MSRLLVVGSGVGGLSAAIHGRLAGYDTAVVSKGSPGGKAAAIEFHSYRLDPGPSIIILPEFYRRVFTLAGRNPDDYLRFHRLDPISQVRFEGQPTVDLPANRLAAENLVDQIDSQDGKSFRRLMEILDEVAPLVDATVFDHPIEKPWQLAHPKMIQMALKFDLALTYKQQIDKWFSSPMLRAFFYGFPSYSGQTYDSKAPGALLIPYLMLDGGVYYPEGGVSAIPKALTRLATELGVEFIDGEVTAAETSGRQVTAVKTESGVLKADAFVCNVDRYTAGDWFGRTTTAEPSFSYFTVHYGFARRLANTSHHMLCIPKGFEKGLEELYREGRFPSQPIVYLNDTSVSDPTVAPPGHTNLFAVITAPADNGKVDWASDIYQKALRKQLETFEIVPADEEPVFERVQTPLTFAKRDGNYRGSLYGVEEKSRLFGMLPEGPHDPAFTNWTYAGGSTQPGAGLPMVLLSGAYAVQALQ